MYLLYVPYLRTPATRRLVACQCSFTTLSMPPAAQQFTPNLCTIGAHTYASKHTVRDASPRKVCRKFCEAASEKGKLALKHVQGLTCYCKRG